MKILVLGGGNSIEREVSFRSARAVSTALRQAGFKVSEADPADGLKILDSLEPDTIVFPILHGAGGEDGEIQKALESRGLPYLGTVSEASVICFDKNLARQVYQKVGLPIASGEKVTKDSYQASLLTKKPHVLKVAKGGSSIGTLIVRNPAKTTLAQIEEVFKLDSEAVVEELIIGIEITVPVFDNKALPVIEIKPPLNPGWFDYFSKYSGVTQELCPPASINSELQTQAQRFAEEAHKALGCRHLSRTDLIVKSDNSMVLLETNVIPGLTDQSLYPKAAAAAGMSMPELTKAFVGLVKRDYGL